MIVSIEFVPTEVRKYHLDVALRVDQNSKNRSIRIVGEGSGAVLRFDPVMVDLGTVLPRSPGDERVVTLTSHSDTAVEVYSLDFDEAYLREEEVLSAVTSIYDENGYYRCPVRLPGHSLSEEVDKAYQKLLEEQAKTKGDNAVGTYVSSAPAQGLGEEEPRVFERPVLCMSPSARDENNHQDIVVVGPPLSGVSSIAHKLSKKTGPPVITVDQIVEGVAATDSDLGVAVRLCCNLSTPEEKQAYQDQLAAAQLAATESIQKQAEALKKEKKPKKGEPERVVPPTAESLALVELEKRTLWTVELLAQVLTEPI